MSVSSPVHAPEPVTAEVVAPPPSPWRFGLRALLGVMGVCSVQFALMNYVGVLEGLAIGVAVCTVAFSAVLLGGMVLSGSHARHLPTLDVLIVRLMIAGVVLLLGTILAGGGTAMYHEAARLRTEQLVESDLGMKLTRVMVTQNNEPVWALRITSVKVGGVAHQANLQQDEVIVVSGEIDEFIKNIYANRGKTVDVFVAIGALNQSVENCQTRTVTLPVPK